MRSRKVNSLIIENDFKNTSGLSPGCFFCVNNYILYIDYFINKVTNTLPMRWLSFLFISILFFQSCSDNTSSNPDVILLLVEKWPTEWKEDGIKDLQAHAALAQLTENGVVLKNAFTSSPESNLALQALNTGMHTGHLLSDDFDKKNLDNFKNAGAAKNYKVLEQTSLANWPENQKDPTIHIIKLNSNSLTELNEEVANLLTKVSPNDLMVFTALAGSGPAYSETSLHVPLIFYTANDKVKKGTSNQAIYTADLFPTIADFLTLPYSTNTIDGQSFYKNIKQPITPLDDRILYWKSSDEKGLEILRYNQWKMYRQNSEAEWQLFDMITDPEETDNVSAYHPGKFGKFQDWVKKNK